MLAFILASLFAAVAAAAPPAEFTIAHTARWDAPVAWTLPLPADATHPPDSAPGALQGVLVGLRNGEMLFVTASGAVEPVPAAPAGFSRPAAHRGAHVYFAGRNRLALLTRAASTWTWRWTRLRADPDVRLPRGDPEFDTYLLATVATERGVVAVSNRGLLREFAADTGRVLWQAQLGEVGNAHLLADGRHLIALVKRGGGVSVAGFTIPATATDPRGASLAEDEPTLSPKWTRSVEPGWGTWRGMRGDWFVVATLAGWHAFALEDGAALQHAKHQPAPRQWCIVRPEGDGPLLIAAARGGVSAWRLERPANSSPAATPRVEPVWEYDAEPPPHGGPTEGDAFLTPTLRANREHLLMLQNGSATLIRAGDGQPLRTARFADQRVRIAAARANENGATWVAHAASASDRLLLYHLAAPAAPRSSTHGNDDLINPPPLPDPPISIPPRVPDAEMLEPRPLPSRPAAHGALHEALLTDAQVWLIGERGLAIVALP